MSLFSAQIDEVNDIMTRLLDSIAATVSSRADPNGAALRRQIGLVRANYWAMLRSGSFGAAILKCFTEAANAKVPLLALAAVRNHLFEEDPQGYLSRAIVQSALLMCLSTEARLISDMDFTSRDDVESLMSVMKVAFDTAKEMIADEMGSDAYQKMNALAGALTQFMVNSARPLPRMINIVLPIAMPSLTASQRVYYVADRAEELAAENRIVHPAFMPIALRGLSE
jgi:hypothetical protein